MSAPELAPPMQFIENKTYDEIAVGDCASLVRTLRPQDIELFAVMSGDVNPAHVDADYAKDDMFHGVIAHGMWGGMERVGREQPALVERVYRDVVERGPVTAREIENDTARDRSSWGWNWSEAKVALE